MDNDKVFPFFVKRNLFFETKKQWKKYGTGHKTYIDKFFGIHVFQKNLIWKLIANACGNHKIKQNRQTHCSEITFGQKKCTFALILLSKQI